MVDANSKCKPQKRILSKLAKTYISSSRNLFRFLLVDYISASINAINILLTLALFVYSLKIREFFKGKSQVGSTTPIFSAAAFFLFLAAVFRAGLIWGNLAPAFQPLELGTRTVGFVLLLCFAYRYARVWATLGK